METISYRCEVCNNRISLYYEDTDIRLLEKPKIKRQKMSESIVDYCEICKVQRTFMKV